MRVITSVLLAIALTVCLPGCVTLEAGSKTPPAEEPASIEATSATFMRYEGVPQQSPLEAPPDRGAGGFREEPDVELTGYAHVKLQDGTKVRALCDESDLETGDSIWVEHRNETWMIVPPPAK